MPYTIDKTRYRSHGNYTGPEAGTPGLHSLTAFGRPAWLLVTAPFKATLWVMKTAVRAAQLANPNHGKCPWDK